MISQKTVTEILETAKVEDVVGEFVNLRRRGTNLIGNCPFHNEKTPSFNVNPARNIYKCFGCGKAGNAVQFLMEHETLTFPDALRWLANKYGIEVDETVPSPEYLAEKLEQESLSIVNEFAKNFYQSQLFETDKGKSIGLNYFKERGFGEDIIKKFALGFAQENRDSFTLAAIQASHKIDILRKLGLTTSFDQDFFRHRVMFTIHSLVGKPIAFAGRIMTKDPKAPKYINSPETEVYSKSKVLYGLFFAKKTIQNLDECLLVEGYTDVISLHQSGVENVVASSGTALTVEQIRLIKRYTKNIKILYDGDPAGIKAALRGMDMILEEDMNVKIVQFPLGEDPDSYIRKVGGTVFKDFINLNAVDFILFKINLLRAEAGNDPIKKAGLIKEIVSSVAKIPDAIKRSVYLRECSAQLQIDENILVSETNIFIKNELSKKQKRSFAEPAPSDDVPYPTSEPPISEAESKENLSQNGDFQEKDIVRILINYGQELYSSSPQRTLAEFLLEDIEELLEAFENKYFSQIVKEYWKMTLNGNQPSESYFFNHQVPEIQQITIDIASSPFEYSENWRNMWQIELLQKSPEQNFILDGLQAVQRFKLKKIKTLIDKNTLRIKDAESQKLDAASVDKFLKVHFKLKLMHDEIAKKLNTVVLR